MSLGLGPINLLLVDLLLLLLREVHCALIILEKDCRVEVLLELVLILAMHDDLVLRLSYLLRGLLDVVHMREIVVLGRCWVDHVVRIGMLPLATLRGC